MSVFTVLKTLASLMPTLLQIISLLDDVKPESGKGSDKLEALKTIVQSAYTVSTDTSVAFEKIWPAIESVVGGLVALFKK